MNACRMIVMAVLFLTTGWVAKGEEMNNGTFEKATFAGGCFWCMQPYFDKLKGIKETLVGYTGGRIDNPTYEQVSDGDTGHAEAIEITYDPKQVDFETLLNVFWENIDPTQENAQFVDHGTQYRSAIFYHSDEQKRIAEESKKKLAASGRFDGPIMTEVVAASKFYPAEDYHQKYYQKSSFRYQMYHDNTGRDEFKEKHWGKNAH